MAPSGAAQSSQVQSSQLTDSSRPAPEWGRDWVDLEPEPAEASWL